MFLIKFGGNASSFGCFETDDYGYFDGEKLRLRPSNQTDEDELELIKESIRKNKNLFVEKWTDIVHYKENVDY